MSNSLAASRYRTGPQGTEPGKFPGAEPGAVEGTEPGNFRVITGVRDNPPYPPSVSTALRSAVNRLAEGLRFSPGHVFTQTSGNAPFLAPLAACGEAPAFLFVCSGRNSTDLRARNV